MEERVQEFSFAQYKIDESLLASWIYSGYGTALYCKGDAWLTIKITKCVSSCR